MDKVSAGRRKRRVGESVRAEVSRLLLREVDDPKMALVTISDVSMSQDLKNAKIYFAPGTGADAEHVGKSLSKAAPFFQRELGRTLKLRFTPKLSFRVDESFDEGSRIDELIQENKMEENRTKNAQTDEQRVAELVADAKKILLCVHANPDGDAIGSLLGMAGIMRNLGKDTIAYCPDGIPGTLSFLPGSDNVSSELGNDDVFDITILMDTADEKLLPTGFPPAERSGTVIVIDHHMRHGDVGDVVIRREVSAVGELIFDLSRALVWPVDGDIAQCLYTSIVSDTGSFRYTSTTANTHKVAGELIALGANSWDTATALYESFPLARQRLLSKVLETLEISDDEKYAELHCTREMLKEVGATKAELDGMINFGRSIRGIEVAALFRVEDEGRIKISFRSKGRVDVAGLAARMGGGGHQNAAGATVTGLTLEEAKTQISVWVEQLLGAGDVPPVSNSAG